MNATLKRALERAVTCVCCEIVKTRKRVPHWVEQNEEELWYELAGCILGSGVRHEDATHAVSLLRERGVLSSIVQPDGSFSALETQVRRTLSSPILPASGGRPGRAYRFPNTRARFLRQTAEAIYGEGNSLSRILLASRSPEHAREQLVSMACGVGPKQASLFLTNVGYADSLAILDVHILRYMSWLDLLPHGIRRVQTLRAYERVEAIFREYARYLGFTVADLDRAVWVTARIASRELTKYESRHTCIRGS